MTQPKQDDYSKVLAEAGLRVFGRLTADSLRKDLKSGELKPEDLTPRQLETLREFPEQPEE